MQDIIEFEGYRFHSLWLRDNCPCSECRHENGQRLHETWQLPADIQIEECSETETGLKIRWAAPHSHEAVFSYEFLRRHAYDKPNTIDSTTALWGGEFNLPEFVYQQVIRDDKQRLEWLDAVEKYGVARLTGVPTQPGMILKVVELFGFVRETNYGTLFEVRTEEKPQNLAYTPIPLSLHTDNPYRNPVPTLQLLHCLIKAEQGGVTALTDGFKAAELLREEDPAAFALLSTETVSFRFSSADADLCHQDRMITVDPQGNITNIRINNRSAAPFQVSFDSMADYYSAYQKLMTIIQSDRCKITLTLDEGDLVLFDNERVLHGREVQAIGTRHLQGCYADRDGLRSTAAVLRRNS